MVGWRGRSKVFENCRFYNVLGFRPTNLQEIYEIIYIYKKNPYLHWEPRDNQHFLLFSFALLLPIILHKIWLGTETVAAFSGPARCPTNAVSTHAKLFSNERVKLPVISVQQWDFFENAGIFWTFLFNGFNLYPGPGCSLSARRCPGVSRYRPSWLLVESFPLVKYTGSAHFSQPVSCLEIEG